MVLRTLMGDGAPGLVPPRTLSPARTVLVGTRALDPPEEAVLLFAGEDASAAEAFAASDPYVANGLVIAWRVRGWTTVVGEGAATPV